MRRLPIAASLIASLCLGLSAAEASAQIDPQEDVLGLYFSQLVPNGKLDLQNRFRTTASAAIETLGGGR